MHYYFFQVKIINKIVPSDFGLVKFLNASRKFKIKINFIET